MVSLYAPGIMKEFNFSNFVFGMIYSGATVLSALTLTFVGKFIDHCNPRNYTLSAVFLLIASCFALAFSINPIFVFLGFWGLRLAGQGLFSHISNISIKRIDSYSGFFDNNTKILTCLQIFLRRMKSF